MIKRRYYSGAEKAPILTVFIGGNHEASSHLFEVLILLITTITNRITILIMIIIQNERCNMEGG